MKTCVGLVVAVVLLAAADAAMAQDAVPLGAPQPARSVRDPEFGVVARHVGLERRVTMLQWRAAPNGYTTTWSPQPIDSSQFAPGHANPTTLPLQGRQWIAETINVDGKPLDAEVVRQLGQWRDFRPSFSALPGNLAATFQPEGDGLGSAENPLHPRVGDLHIGWRELVLPPLDGRIALRDGRWQLVAPAVVPQPVDAETSRAASTPSNSGWWAWWVAAVAAVVLIATAVIRLRRRHPT